MRLFRVDKEWGNITRGHRPLVPPEEREIIISTGDQGPGVYFSGKEPEGDTFFPPALALPVQEELAGPFTDGPSRCLRLTAARLVGTKEGEEKRLVPSTAGELSRIYEGAYYGPCLLHVCVPGTRVVTANTTEEWLEPTGRGLYKVRHKHLGIAHAAGVEIVAMNEENTEAIFRVWPLAAFRIFKEAPPEESPELLVNYDGCMPRVVRPRKYITHVRHSSRPERRTEVFQA